MIKPVFYIIFLFCFSKFTAQENLVPNGSFEEYNWCPSFTEGYTIDACKFWTSPTSGTPDYFHNCSIDYDSFLSSFYFSVPENYNGFQQAKTGIAYSGISYTQGELPEIPELEETFSEYIQIELDHNLEKGKLYNLSFYISNAHEDICGNSIGALFSYEEINESHDHNLNVTPDYQSDLNYFFCDSTKWFLQSYNFIAQGTERFLILGVFTMLHESKTSDYNGNIISGPGMYGANEYFYIDDVSLTEIELQIPNVLTPNNDGINDYFELKNIPSNCNLTILNRWGQCVFKTEEPNIIFWDGTANGILNSEGIYFYVLEFDNSIKTGFLQLTR